MSLLDPTDHKMALALASPVKVRDGLDHLYSIMQSQEVRYKYRYRSQ